MSAGDALVALKAHVARADYPKPLRTLEDVQSYLESCYPSLERSVIKDDDGQTWTVVCCAKATIIGHGVGPIKPARVVFEMCGSYAFQVLLKPVKIGEWQRQEPGISAELKEMLDSMLANSEFLLCPGIREYEKTFHVIRFESKNLRDWKTPFQRHDSSNCSLWHKPSNLKIGVTSPLFNCCSSCKLLYHDLDVIKKRIESASPEHKEKWLDVSSNRPLKYLSPASRITRMTKSSQDRRNLRKSLFKKDHPLDVSLDDEQHDEMSMLVAAIEEKGQEELEEVMKEAESSGESCSMALKEVWERDVKERKDFFGDQLQNSKV